jgi:hypothetical protein
MFPTLGVGMEEALKHDAAAIVAAFRGFNQWLADDWGYDDYCERIFAAPRSHVEDVAQQPVDERFGAFLDLVATDRIAAVYDAALALDQALQLWQCFAGV